MLSMSTVRGQDLGIDGQVFAVYRRTDCAEGLPKVEQEKTARQPKHVTERFVLEIHTFLCHISLRAHQTESSTSTILQHKLYILPPREVGLEENKYLWKDMVIH